jgi:hypothetical protein
MAVPKPVPSECIGVTAGDGREICPSPVWKSIIIQSFAVSFETTYHGEV